MNMIDIQRELVTAHAALKYAERVYAELRSAYIASGGPDVTLPEGRVKNVASVPIDNFDIDVLKRTVSRATFNAVTERRVVLENYREMRKSGRITDEQDQEIRSVTHRAATLRVTH